MKKNKKKKRKKEREKKKKKKNARKRIKASTWVNVALSKDVLEFLSSNDHFCFLFIFLFPARGKRKNRLDLYS